MDDVAAVLLAAGMSGRMGEQNKLCLPVDADGTPMTRAVAIQIAAVVNSPVIVVTGHERHAVERALHGMDAQFIHNPDYGRGQMTSVLAGVDAAPSGLHVMIALADQPGLTANDLQDLLACHAGAADGTITIPFPQNPWTDGQRGNPIVLTPGAADEVRSNRTNPGCRNLTEREPGRIHRFETDCRAFYDDIDTPEAYSRLAGARD